MKNYGLFFIFLLVVLSGISQEKVNRNFIGGSASINHSLKISNRYSLKTAYEFRSAGKPSNDKTTVYESRHDFTLGLQRKLSTFFSGAAGGMVRFSNLGEKQRLYQQIGYVQQTLSRFKIAHRFRVDETFSTAPTEYRLRYRFAAELPSRGFRTDPKESYVAVLSEFLGKFKGNDYEPEFRIATQFGYLFESGNKGEFLIELRVEDFKKDRLNLFIAGIGYYFNK